MVFVSISLRYLVNMESLNGIESVGNISRHRVAPMIIPTNNEYSVKYVPAVSGESIAHAYQMLLVDEALKKGLPVGKRSKLGELLKYTDEALLKEENISEPENYDDARRFEVDVMLKDIVSDIGGFMYTGKARDKKTKIPVKRTSVFQVSYMIPVYDSSSETAALEAQFHMRFSPSDIENYQNPYTVEVGSALYTFTFNIDTDKIAVPSTEGKKTDNEELLQSQKDKRIEVAKNALIRLLENLDFGAKRSRFSPIAELRSAVGIKSLVPIVVNPGVTSNYINDTYTRVTSLEQKGIVSEPKLLAINKENLNIKENIDKVETISDLISQLF
jgi:CRISPR-associated protein Csa2